MKKRKRIALLLGQPEEDNQALFIEGFLSQAFADDFDVCVFAMYQKYQETQAREIGESHIFSLVDESLFDAFVILGDTIQTPQIADRIEDRLKERFHGPVICVDRESRYFPTVMTDHYSLTKKLIAHLIEVHGFRDIAYLAGKKWHSHSKLRLAGFLDTMKEYGLEVGANRIFYGDFWYTSGEIAVESLMRDPEHLPEAIACANDCMAIGVAQALDARGIRVPEDIAVIGYDSIQEGRMSPQPITSAPMPFKECGVYVAKSIEAAFRGETMPAFKADNDLFIGCSCGCHGTKIGLHMAVRKEWATDISAGSYYSCYNHIMEDMLNQTDFEGLMNTIFSYVYQIREFHSFHLCLNEGWKHLEDTEQEISWKDYSDRMLQIIRCGADRENSDRVDFEDTFAREVLLPELSEKRDVPMAFIFTPLHFEEKCFGYAVISYGNAPHGYEQEYRLWIRSVMQGLECLRRAEELKRSNRILEASRIRDNLTGFYNYKGFIANAGKLLDKAERDEQALSVLVLDICNLDKINIGYGREAGNQAILAIAGMLEKYRENGMVCGLGNGEFAVTVPESPDTAGDIRAVRESVEQEVAAYNREHTLPYVLAVYAGSMTKRVHNTRELEQLLSGAVSQKNGAKASSQKTAMNMANLTDEEMQEALVVKDILDRNRFRYHFQPIVRTTDGSIYAYEALMRPDVEPAMSPVKVLKYAEAMDRLYDVERATFFNVLDYISRHPQEFGDCKVFVNSIPGRQLNSEDQAALQGEMQAYSGVVVVELTEQTEISDEKLEKLKQDYSRMGVETAVDDYGTGYSNITNLLRYMPNYVKIDRMLLTEIQNSPQKQHFVSEIVAFAHDNDIMALAEGVETTEELRTVIALGADLIQGFYTARPAAEVIPELSPEMRNEITRYRHMAMSGSGTEEYIAGKENRVSVVSLAAKKYRTIRVPAEGEIHRDITLVGTPGMESKMDLAVEEGYHGRIELENIHLQAKKNAPCIDIGRNCEVTLALKGDNVLKLGGIRVPKDSHLTLIGSGNLNITLCDSSYYAIGNDADNAHGTLEFDQDGNTVIEGNVVRAIGIGAGKGGEIYINRGKYMIQLNGDEGVAVGALSSDVQLTIHDCNLEIENGCGRGVGIGSLDGNCELSMEHMLVKCTMNGQHAVAVGTIEGAQSHVKAANGSLIIRMHGDRVCGIGSERGDTAYSMQAVSLTVQGEGKEAIVMGNWDETALIDIDNSGVETRLRTRWHTDIGAQECDIRIVNGVCHFVRNGNEVVRACTEREI